MFDRSWPAWNRGPLPLTLALIVQAAAALAGNPPPDGRTFGECVGLQVHFDQGEPPAHLENLKDLGVRWVREDEPWPAVEAKPGHYVWPERFRKRLKFYADSRINVIFLIIYGNGTAYPDDPYNPDAYARFAVEAA